MFRETGTNYRGNTGIGPAFMVWVETPDSGNGVFPENEVIRPADLRDGLSHTAAFSERVSGIGAGQVARSRAGRLPAARHRQHGRPAPEGLPGRRRPGNPGYATSGRWWFWTGRGRTLYTHTQEPNGAIPDCSYGNFLPEIDMATARSRHPGGVNALMADGSVRFVSDAIARPVWRGLGTRNGGELVE